MLDDRKATILRAVVEQYVSTAQPVGSGHVASSSGVAVSPATIRNDMAYLEHEGYLFQPHTSAGRMPTDKGYRFYVDHLASLPTLAPVHLQAVRDFFARAHGELEEVLESTSRLLTRLTDYAAVVVPPPPDPGTVRSVQLVALSSRLVLGVLVQSSGAITKVTLDTPEEPDPETVRAATAHLAAHIEGRGVDDVGPVPDSGDPAVDALVAATLGALADAGARDHDALYVGGASQMAMAFDAVETVRGVLATLEQQYVVVTLLRDVVDRGLSVAIGAEHGVQPLAECSIVVAPYGVEGRHVGSIAVLGPTRMDYPNALAAVAAVSSRLSQALTDG